MTKPIVETPETPVLLLPEIYDEAYSSIDSETYTLIYELPGLVRHSDWNGNLLALSHDKSISILTPVTNTSRLSQSLPSKFQRDWCFQLTTIPTHSPITNIKFTSKFLVTSHEDYTVTVLNHLDESKRVLDRGHTKDINSIDVSDNGLIVSASDDKTVLIWGNDSNENKTISLNNIPTFVKFWIDKDLDKVIIVENNQVVKVYDWRKNQLLYSIYPETYSKNAKGFVRDVFIINNRIVIVGDGWTKTYDPEKGLNGGAGFTYPQEEVQLNGCLINSKYISSGSNLTPHVGSIGNDRSSFYALNSQSNQVSQIKLQIPSINVSTGTINPNGIVAFASGERLILTRPFDSYEVVQNL